MRNAVHLVQRVNDSLARIRTAGVRIVSEANNVTGNIVRYLTATLINCYPVYVMAPSDLVFSTQLVAY